MKNEKNYITINNQAWNNKVDVHIASDFYANKSFFNGKSTLNSIELELLGDLRGKKVLHLQCHFGQDSLSMARLGATVIGVDLSEKAIEKAKEFSEKLKLDANFICCDVYDLPNQLSEKFDIVFTSYGTIGWLPDLYKWGNIISHFLKPSGKFIMVDFHPVVWMYDNEFKEVYYSYFNIEPIFENELGTYADRNSKIEITTVTWNHPISDILNSLIKNNLEIISFNEFDYSPYNCFNETEEFEKGKFRLKPFGNKIPMIYSIHAFKK
jgi:SAM-dependent methyltransferase